MIDEERGGANANRSAWSDFWGNIKTLLPFLWPKKSTSLQVRVLICFLLLAAGRVSNVYVPILYKLLGMYMNAIN